MANMNKDIICYITSFERSVKIIEASLELVKKWESDTIILEEYLMLNHRGWELLFKTFSLFYCDNCIQNHHIIKHIYNFKEKNILNRKAKNLYEFFLGDISIEYYKMLDDLFANTNSRYSDINDILGIKSLHMVVDRWIKDYAFINSLNYDLIRNNITEINNKNLQFIASHFSNNKNEKIISPIFHNYNKIKKLTAQSH